MARKLESIEKEFNEYIKVFDNYTTFNVSDFDKNEKVKQMLNHFAAWNFYIGGYQPAQKWLKDRVGREMSEEDYVDYNKIIVALMETDRIMEEIDILLES